MKLDYNPNDESIEQWLEKAKRKGYKLNNLFQKEDGQFQSNFRAATNRFFTTFGYGNTPQEAIDAALRNKSVLRAIHKPTTIEPKTQKRKRKRLPKRKKLPKGTLL